MKVTVTSSAAKLKGDAILFFTTQDADLASIDAVVAGAQHTASGADFSGKKSTTCSWYPTDAAVTKAVVAGLGEADAVTAETVRRAAGTATKEAVSKDNAKIVVVMPEGLSLDAETVAQAITEAVGLATYKYDKYLPKDAAGKHVGSLTIFVQDKADTKAVKSGSSLALAMISGVNAARDLANAPGNDIYAETLAKTAQKLGKEHGFKTTVFNKKKIESMGMNGLLAVNAGSHRPPTFIVMEYMNGPKDEKPVVLVGKGVTFDSGGISIKPSAGMADMKMDMHGSASVVGAMTSIAAAGLKKNVVGLVPSTDNMPGGGATTPGDVITYSNGVTVEVDNTDAEGRLILADALIYADKYKPAGVIDLATLTGACVVALGFHATGVMGNNPEFMQKLKAASEITEEVVCELPLLPEYEDILKSSVAHIKNSGARWAGAITAGIFLSKFVGDYPWIHMDIAGTGMVPTESAYTPKGGTGVAVRTLTTLVKNWK